MTSYKDKEFQMVTCLGKHGSYTFYKSIRVGERTISLSNFFPVRIWPDSAILSIAEVQLLWKDRNESLCSLRLYFLPENTPFGRFSFHGEDEVIALQDRVIIKASDLMTWIVDEQDWDWGYVTPNCKPEQSEPLAKGFGSEKYEKEDKLVEFIEQRSNSVVVLNYDRYIRLRTVLKRLEGSPDIGSWLSHPLVMAIGGVGVGPKCRILFARDVFDYPELEDHELLCNHLAPKLKGRQGRKKKRTRNLSSGSVSNDSESSSSGSSASADKLKPRKIVNGLSGHPDSRLPTLPLSRAARIMEERGLEALQRELLLSTNANGLQILKVDSSQIPRNGQIGSGSGGKRSYNQQSGRRVVDSRGASSSSMDFAPGLNELAAKLKRSNALQILAIRPPLGSHGMGDLDMFQLSKRMRLDPELEMMSSLLGRINSDLFIHPQNTGPYTARKHTIYGAPIVDKVVSKTHEVVKQMVGFTQSQKSSTNKKISLQQEKPQKEPVTPSNIDADLREFMSIKIPSNTDSPFRGNNRIFGNPAGDRLQLPEGFSRSKEGSESILDFSVRKSSRQQQHPSDQITRRALSARSTDPVDLLDLTIKPSSLGSSRGHDPLYGRQGSNIPLPNAIDKLGLQLTSEVTLFPSPSYMGKVKENKSVSKAPSSSSPSALSGRNSGSRTMQGSSGSSSSSSSSRSKSMRSPATMGSASAVIQGASSGGGRASASPKEVSSLRHHSSHTPHHPHHHPHLYPNHLNTKPVFGPPGGLHGSSLSSSSAITIKPMSSSSSEEKQHAAKLKELEKAYQSLSAAPPFMAAPGGYGVAPKMDPAYLSLLTNPFLMSPQALMSIPGAMEQFQMYKDLFQQSGIPQFPLHWPPPGPGGNERGGK